MLMRVFDVERNTERVIVQSGRLGSPSLLFSLPNTRHTQIGIRFNQRR